MEREPGLRPSVGVVIPVYNGAAFLEEALASLVVQHERPSAVVVVDDGSTDASVDIARRYQDRLELEIVRLAGRGGVSAARNAGVARLDTQLVAFLDADDVWYPEHLQQAVDAYVTNGGLISPAALLWYPDGSTRSFHGWLGLRVPRRSKQLPALLQHNFVFVGALLPRADFVAVGGFRPPNVAEDWDLWIRLLARGLHVTQLDEPTVLYRRHGENTTRERAQLIPSIVEVLRRAEGELSERYGPDIRRSIERHIAELELEAHLTKADAAGTRPPWRAVRAGLRGPARVRLKAALYGLSPRLARRVSGRGGGPPPTAG